MNEPNMADPLNGVPARDDSECRPRSDAGTDTSIAKRLERNPESKDARLDRALDESMDASDPPASTQPIHSNDPAPSSGYDAKAEASRGQKGIVGRVLGKLGLD